MDALKVGIVGAAGRGGRFKAAMDAIDALRVHAVCDVNADGLDSAADLLDAPEKYLDYGKMLDRSDVDAVVIGTPMQFHASQAVAALERGVHVLSEVTAAVSLEECRALVRACRESAATYMMAENYTYSRPNQIVKEMVRRGEFGKTYYAEGEYLHEVKGLNERTPWRRRWHTGIDGVTYGTHSLGPILQWMPGDRVERVCAAGGGRHHVDPRGDAYENQASTVMLCQMRSGGLVKIRLDMLSDRPHSLTNYELQGMDGCYESARAAGDVNRVWLRSRDTANAGAGPHDDAHREWMDLEELAEEFLPESWRLHGELARRAGHGGGDLLEFLDFVDAIERGVEPVIGIHQAMDMTLPGLISQQSIARGGRWLDVPDSRDW